MNTPGRLQLCGHGFPSDDEAAVAGKKWRDWLTAAFARNDVGADFGDRAPQGGFSPAGLEWTGSTPEQPVLQDVHGLMTFPSEPAPRFAMIGPASVRAGRAHTSLAEALQDAKDADLSLSDVERLAYDLYAASFSETNADARFIMLMMALETLIDQKPRSAGVIELVNSFISQASGSGIEKKEMDSLSGSLQSLRNESIGQAGRRLAEQLGDKPYDGQDLVKFFSTCYAMRSNLVHGSKSRPSRDEVSRGGASLQVFISDLLAQCGTARSQD